MAKDGEEELEFMSVPQGDDDDDFNSMNSGNRGFAEADDSNDVIGNWFLNQSKVTYLLK